MNLRSKELVPLALIKYEFISNNKFLLAGDKFMGRSKRRIL